MTINSKILWGILGALLGGGAFLAFFRTFSEVPFSAVSNVVGLFALVGAVFLPWLVGRRTKGGPPKPAASPVAAADKKGKTAQAETPPPVPDELGGG